MAFKPVGIDEQDHFPTRVEDRLGADFAGLNGDGLAVNADGSVVGASVQATPPTDTSRLWVDTGSTVGSQSGCFVTLEGAAATCPAGYGLGITAPFNFAAYDDSQYFDATNSQFVIPESGRYRVTTQVGFSAGSAGVRWVQIYRDRAGGLIILAASAQVAIPNSVLLPVNVNLGACALTAGDKVYVVVRHTHTEALSLPAGAYQSWMAIERAL